MLVSGADPFVKHFHALSLRSALGTVYLPRTSQIPVGLETVAGLRLAIHRVGRVGTSKLLS